MKSLSAFLRTSNDYPDVSDRVRVGSQMGSNPGGQFKAADGSLHYMKFYKNEQQARTEVAASKVYEMAGVPTLRPQLVRHNGKLAVSTPWRTDLQPHTGYDDHQQLARHLVAAVLTKNWDAVGLSHGDNMMHDSEGRIHSVDLGGSMRFRAQGGPKPFGDDVAELESLRHNGYASGVAFGRLSDAEIHHAVHTTQIDPGTLREHFRGAGLEDAEAHAQAVTGRLAKLRALV